MQWYVYIYDNNKSNINDNDNVVFVLPLKKEFGVYT